MESKELDLEQIRKDLDLARTQRPDLLPLFSYVETLIAEVERLRGYGLKEYNWNDIDGYGGGYDYTVVASSLEEAREFAKERFNGPGGSDSFLKYVYNTEPDIYDFSPKGKGYYEYHMDAGG